MGLPTCPRRFSKPAAAPKPPDMPRLSGHRLSPAEEDEGYFISMSDMLTGLLFVFIILVFYFALQLRQTTQELLGAADARTKLLKDIETDLHRRNVDAEIDENNGVLRLRGVAMFGDDDARLTQEGIRSVGAVAEVLQDRLPCITDVATGAVDLCRHERSAQRVETMLIEGHTDKRPRLRGTRDTNIDLSTMRAINTYLALVDHRPGLEALIVRIPTADKAQEQPILSVSGYGSKRPVPGFENDTPESLQKNRRIDLRFLMVTPRASG